MDTDVGMPVMSGLEARRREEVGLALPAGVLLEERDDYIRKPFAGDSLREVLGRC